ncbi:lanthionine synthetase C family protein [Clostridium rectalis]|uniref:lanthionine synthetase C family protein n=1 Tax=Clostridium rectalis TaxID=2040295 RepID=UPI001FAA4DAF|nr:lanthionine synthetase C family protein [Clostridium rectalis]
MEQELYNLDIREIVYNTAFKLSDYNKILGCVTKEENYIEIDGEKISRFNELSLSEGIPSLCILYGELNELYPEDGWDVKGHEYIKKIGELLEEDSNLLLSMFSGLSGIGLSAICLSKNGTRYKGFINTVNKIIKNQIGDFLSFLNKKSGVDVQDYDAISGVSGILNYCMLFENDMEEEIILMLNYIVELCKYKNFRGIDLPGWYIKPEKQITKQEKELWEKGCFNLGLSHGVPSLLVNLCNAENLNIKVKGQRETIEKISEFLFNYRVRERREYGWDYVVTLEEYNKNINNKECCRDAWCYGAPGVAYSLLLSGRLLNNKEYIDYAFQCIKIASKRLKCVHSPTFCHGYSGIAYISNKFYELTNIDEFKFISLELYNKILSFYDEKNIFNFVDIDKKLGKVKSYNSIGILEGVVGIILTLLSIKEGRKTPWDTAFSLGDYKQRY